MRFCLSIILCIQITCFYGIAQEPKIEATRVIQGPVVDGGLYDPVRDSANSFSRFRMVKPTPGSESTEITEVRIIYNNNSFFIGIRCYDSEPLKIAANTMQHDNSEDRNEDQISILLDPFQDKRIGYLFIVNPKGARSEGYASGEHYSRGWDGIWNENKGGNKQAWGLKLDYPNDLLDMTIVYNFYGDSLDPGLGFLPRSAYHYL